MKARTRIAFGVLLTAASTSALVVTGGTYGYRLNLTDSAPSGIWRVLQRTKAVTHGDIVSVCPPNTAIVVSVRDAGLIASDMGPLQWGSKGCSSKTVPLLKPVVATAGDLVSVTRHGVSVNGRVLRNSASADLVLGMPATPEGTYQVQPGQLWVISSYSPQSFDSRYFGPVSENAVRGFAHAVAVRGSEASIFSDAGEHAW